ncbi:aminotransferase class III-fold pyridoxal phosphate-dependent enzyme, partial [Nocardia cyriacigeorgica]
VAPDVITIAKGLASGFPLSGIAASRELMAKAWPGSQGGTYGGNAVACAAAIATLEVIESEGLVRNAAERGAQLLAGMRALESKAIGDVRGLGLLVGAEFVTAAGEPDREAATRAQALAVQKGLLLLTCGAHMNVVRMIPPLVVSRTQIDDALAIWAQVLAELPDASRP